MKLVGVGGFRENSNIKHPIKLYLRDEKLLLYFDRIIFIKIRIMRSHEYLVSVLVSLGLAPLGTVQCPRGLCLFSAQLTSAWAPGASRSVKAGCFQHPREDRHLSFSSLPQNNFYLSQRKSKFIFKKLSHRTSYSQNKILKHCK